MTRRRGTPVAAGRFYQQTSRGLVPTDPDSPDVWVCRRLEDFPDGVAPPGAAVDACSRCAAAIAYNPARVPTVPADTPRVCMQCFDIAPDPLS